jgi:PilZ domain-containing protein
MGTQPRRDAVTSQAGIERRRSPRVDVVERVQGYVRPLDTPIGLLNINESGFLVQAPIDYPIGEIHEFGFRTPGDPIVLSARVVHTMRATTQQGLSYLIGLEFVDRGTPSGEHAIQTLLARVPIFQRAISD